MIWVTDQLHHWWPLIVGLATCIGAGTPLYMFIISREEQSQRNIETEQTWHAKPEALKEFGGIVPSLPVDTLTAHEKIELKSQNHAAFTQDGEHVIWAVIGRFNTQEALDNLNTACVYFNKLGKPELAKSIWDLAVKEYKMEPTKLTEEGN